MDSIRFRTARRDRKAFLIWNSILFPSSLCSPVLALPFESCTKSVESFPHVGPPLILRQFRVVSRACPLTCEMRPENKCSRLGQLLRGGEASPHPSSTARAQASRTFPPHHGPLTWRPGQEDAHPPRLLGAVLPPYTHPITQRASPSREEQSFSLLPGPVAAKLGRT